MVLETGASSIASFLGLGTEFLTWVITSMTSLLNFMMSQPAIACFLIAGLIYVVVRLIKSFVRI